MQPNYELIRGPDICIMARRWACVVRFDCTRGAEGKVGGGLIKAIEISK